MQIPQQPGMPGQLNKPLPGLQKAPPGVQPRAAEVRQDAAALQSVLSKSYATLEKRLSIAMKEDPAAVKDKPVSQGDFSPAAVSERIMGFITQRLESERANGASEDKLIALYNQATKGLEQGFGEAAKIIEGNGLFQGKVKEDFFETLSLVEKGMTRLKEDLFGKPADAADAAPAPVQGAQAVAVEAGRAESFAMQIKTREGDVIDLQVSAAQRLSYQAAGAYSDRGSMQAFAASYESESTFSFSVQGDLSDAEMASISALFDEVNEVAELFFSGKVDEAFDRALSVGLDAEQLAGFAVNMSRTEVVAARQAYSQVRNNSEPSEPDQMFKALADFAARVKQADIKLANTIELFDTRPVLAELLAKLKPEAGVEPPADATPGAAAPPQPPRGDGDLAARLPEQASDTAKQRVNANDQFREFVSRLLA